MDPIHHCSQHSGQFAGVFLVLCAGTVCWAKHANRNFCVLPVGHPVYLYMILSHLGSQIGAFLHDTSYWAVKLRDNRWRCELDGVPDIRTATTRNLDWSLDIVGSGENNKIKELW